MSISRKLFLGFSAVILVLMVLTYESYLLTSDMKEFTSTDMATAMDAADGTMESRINYLHAIWGALEGSMATTAENLEEGHNRFNEAREGFEETYATLVRSGILPQERLDSIRASFDALVANGEKMFMLRGKTMGQMEALDADVVELSEGIIDAELPPTQVHLVWSYANGVNDFAAYHEEAVLEIAEEEAVEIESLTLPGSLASKRDKMLEHGSALIETSKANKALRKDFDDVAEKLDSAMEAIEEGDDTFQGADAYVEELFEELHNIASSAFVTSMLFSGGGILIALVLAFLITRSIVGPVNRIRDYTRKVGDGDLDATVQGTFSGELAAMNESLQSMVGTLKTKMQEAQESSDEAAHQTEQARQALQEAEEAKRQAERAKSEGMLQAASRLEAMVERTSSATQQLASQAEQISKGANEQSERAAETATAMEEMSATVIEVARNSSSAAENSEDNRQKAIEGKNVVAQTIESIMEVQGSTAELSMVMNELSTKAESIGQVMSVINDIADQTNLLALNAAIEAARAGEAGRGFAVVADEVRKLAEKTMSATKEVGDAIHGIQESVRSTSSKREQAESALERTIDLAQNAGELLGAIVGQVEEAAAMVSSIATAAEEQSATAEEINRSVEAINNIAAETARGMAESVEAVDDLSRQAQSMQRLLDDLKSEANG